MVINKKYGIVLGIILMLFMVGFVSAATRYVNDNGQDDGGCTVSVCLTIQYAIDQADSEDVVTVFNGAYNEDLYINKTITLNSTGGASNAIINGSIRINSSADNTVIGGSSGHGFEIVNRSVDGNPAGFKFLIGFVEGAADNVEISYNTINITNATTASDTAGILIEGTNLSGLKVYENTFYINETSIGIFEDTNESFSNFNITGNTFNIADTTGTLNYTAAIKLTSPNVSSSDSTIARNTFRNALQAIILGNITNGTGIKFGSNKLNIDNNTFFTVNIGVDIVRAFDADGVSSNNSQNINITNNNFTGIADTAIAINASNYIPINIGHLHPSNFTVSGNLFQDIEILAINNSAYSRSGKRERTVIAENNFWGDGNGPGHGPKTGGTAGGGGNAGENVSTFVDFSPWCSVNWSCVDTNNSVVGAAATAYDSITAALANASYNDIIEVENSSVWYENISISERVTLRGAVMTDTSVVLNGTITLAAGSNSSVIGGTTGRGFKIEGATIGIELIKLAVATDNVEISYNIINTTGLPAAGIEIEDNNISGITISYNTFWLNAAGIGISNPDDEGIISSITIQNNTFDNAAGNADNYTAAIFLTSLNVSTTASLISGNVINDGDLGIVIGNLTDDEGIRFGSSHLRIDNNTFYRTNLSLDLVSIDTTTENSTNDIKITWNNFTESRSYAIALNVSLFNSNLVGRMDCGNFTVKNNIFDGTVLYAINNSKYCNLTAEENFWGNTSAGKSTGGSPGNEGGDGDNITVVAYVDYDPWYTSSNMTVFSNVTTAASSSSSDTPSSGGGLGVEVTWKFTHFATEEEFEEGYTQKLSKKQRIKVMIEDDYHYVGVSDLTESTATIQVSSEVQEVTMLVGDERKFDVTDDEFYDISVKLNSIEGSKADITIKSIYEEVTEEAIEEQVEKEMSATELREQELARQRAARRRMWIWIIVIVAVVLVGAGIWFGFGKKKKVVKK